VSLSFLHIVAQTSSKGTHGLEIVRDAVRISPPAKGLLRRGFLNSYLSVVACGDLPKLGLVGSQKKLVDHSPLGKDKGGVIKPPSSFAS
jgi:hypothetical protein